MAFGLIKWSMSLIIFSIVLAIITWSAVHLGRKSARNVTESVASRFLYLDDRPVRKDSNSLSLASNSTRATKNIDASTSFANDQGSEIPDSADFYKIIQAFRPTKLINATLSSFTVDDDSTWSENEATTKLTRQSVTLHDYSNLTDEIIKSSSDISRTATYPTIAYEARIFDANRLQKPDLHQSVRVDVSDFSPDVSIAFFQRASSNVTHLYEYNKTNEKNTSAII